MFSILIDLDLLIQVEMSHFCVDAYQFLYKRLKITLLKLATSPHPTFLSPLIEAGLFSRLDQSFPSASTRFITLTKLIGKA
jgi:hypothetical protein